MAIPQWLKKTNRGLAMGAGVAAVGYVALMAFNYWRYGKAAVTHRPGQDLLLDRYIPVPEVVEQHNIAINAPPDVVLATAKKMELLNSPMIRAIIKLRELAMGGAPDDRVHPTQLLDQMRSIGWVVLAETAGREIVLGAVTQPWVAAPVFRSIPASEFAGFSEPGYVKIAWTLRADPLGDQRSIFRTETRVSTTDAESRARFRKYWAFVAPGVELIRFAMLRPLKKEVERKMHLAVA